jgi:hypothetical protein
VFRGAGRQSGGPGVRKTVLLSNAIDRLPAPFGANKFPEATSLSTCLLKRKIGNETLEADILPLQLLHPLRLIELKTTVFLSPAM